MALPLCRAMDEAFADLRGLMAKAQEMVALAERFRAALARGDAGAEQQVQNCTKSRLQDYVSGSRTTPAQADKREDVLVLHTGTPKIPTQR